MLQKIMVNFFVKTYFQKRKYGQIWEKIFIKIVVLKSSNVKNNETKNNHY